MPPVTPQTTKSHKFPRKSLEAVSQQLLGEGKEGVDHTQIPILHAGTDEVCSSHRWLNMLL